MTSTKPIPPPPPQNQQEEKQSSSRFYSGIFSIVLILTLAFGITLWIRHNKKTPNNPPSITQIQQTFQPPTSSPANPSVVTSQPSGQVSGAQTGTSTPPAAPSPQLYTNQALGFSLQLGPDWQAKPFSDNEIVLANQTGNHYSIQVYNNAPADLSIIKQQLQGSPSVKMVSGTIFLNQPAISFTTTSGQPGLAVINNTKLYYIMGLLTSTPLNSFQFLSQNSF